MTRLMSSYLDNTVDVALLALVWTPQYLHSVTPEPHPVFLPHRLHHRRQDLRREYIDIVIIKLLSQTDLVCVSHCALHGVLGPVLVCPRPVQTVNSRDKGPTPCRISGMVGRLPLHLSDLPLDVSLREVAVVRGELAQAAVVHCEVFRSVSDAQQR